MLDFDTSRFAFLAALVWVGLFLIVLFVAGGWVLGKAPAPRRIELPD